MDSAVQYPDVHMNLVRPKAPVMGTIVSNDLCMRGKSASFVKHTVIDISGTALAGTFRAGQSFGVIPPGADQDGKPHKVRLYSIACPSWGEDGQGMRLSTTPKRVVDEFVAQKAADDVYDHSLFLGVCSNYLCDLRPGDPVALSGPQGKRFLLPEAADEYDYLFIATGTGIAPFRGMVLELLTRPQGPTSRRIDLVMGTPYTTDLLYDDLFRTLASEHDNFNYHTAISRESEPQYVSGLIDHQMGYFADLLHSEHTLIYVCGLEGMEQGLYATLLRHQLADGYFRQNGKHLKATARCMLEIY
jgi:ferredoxin--NADP+ reductase